ncbi:hypothetical protein RJ640_023249 [Escallonia rubra]|uniref:Uncharacterized protein n=1 Tax=Escallonia rubra TaxID=112253 RepID=A0AA88RYY5_9ASTE|nr:hypothetical protein RJ640_023249 [Escallonia rubra]
MESGENDDEGRCRRRGTPTWRCKERALTGQTLCSKHFIHYIRSRDIIRQKRQASQAAAACQSSGGNVVSTVRWECGEASGENGGNQGQSSHPQKWEGAQAAPAGEDPGGNGLPTVAKLSGENGCIVVHGGVQVQFGKFGGALGFSGEGADTASGGGGGSVERKGKMGRPKGSKNKKKKLEMPGGIVVNGGVEVQFGKVGGGLGFSGEGADTVSGGGGGNVSRKGKMGRPKGSKNKKKKLEMPGGIVDGSEVVKEKAKMGRPNGSKNKKKNLVEGVVGSSDAVAGIVKKKDGRGRPKGSRNKKKPILAANDGLCENVAQVMENEKPVVGVKEFESGKCEGDNVERQGSHSEVPNFFVEHQNYAGEVNGIDDGVTQRRNRGIPKRSRKRPRLIIAGEIQIGHDKLEKDLATDANAIECFSESNGMQKRPRGRPRKATCAGEFTSSRLEQGTLLCHQCKNYKPNVIICSNCKRKRYCYECLAKWYPDRRKKEVKNACPSCCGNCNCKACLQADVVMASHSEVDKTVRLQRLLYLLHKTLPLLRQIQEGQKTELDVEAHIRGSHLAEEDLTKAIFDDDDRVYW